MHASLFSQLADTCMLSEVRAFSQQKWRVLHYPPAQATMCAGLTYFWLIGKMQASAPLSKLAVPDAALLRQIAQLQALSYYPAFPPHFTPGEKDLALLARKYGTQDWTSIQHRVEAGYQSDYVLYDLARMFTYTSASILRLHALPQTLPSLPTLAAGTAVIGVLRYLENARSSGHRLAYWRDHDERHHFFDPNAGEIIAADDTSFHRWLECFLDHSAYRKLQAAEDEAFLTLYLLESVNSLQGGAPRGHALVESA